MWMERTSLFRRLHNAMYSSTSSGEISPKQLSTALTITFNIKQLSSVIQYYCSGYVTRNKYAVIEIFNWHETKLRPTVTRNSLGVTDWLSSARKTLLPDWIDAVNDPATPLAMLFVGKHLMESVLNFYLHSIRYATGVRRKCPECHLCNVEKSKSFRFCSRCRSNVSGRQRSVRERAEPAVPIKIEPWPRFANVHCAKKWDEQSTCTNAHTRTQTHVHSRESGGMSSVGRLLFVQNAVMQELQMSLLE